MFAPRQVIVAPPMSAPLMTNPRMSMPPMSAPHMGAPLMTTQRMGGPIMSAPRMTSPMMSAPRMAPHMMNMHQPPRVAPPMMNIPRVASPIMNTPRVASPIMNTPRVAPPMMLNTQRVASPQMTHLPLQPPPQPMGATPTVTPYVKPPRKPEVKRHNCPHCEKAFAYTTALEQHILTHTGEKPHVCPTCNKAFSVKNNLTRHMLVHTGEKKYKCPTSEKAFTAKSSMQRHMVVHDEAHQAELEKKAAARKGQYIDEDDVYTPAVENGDRQTYGGAETFGMTDGVSRPWEGTLSMQTKSTGKPPSGKKGKVFRSRKWLEKESQDTSIRLAREKREYRRLKRQALELKKQILLKELAAAELKEETQSILDQIEKFAASSDNTDSHTMSFWPMTKKATASIGKKFPPDF